MSYTYANLQNWYEKGIALGATHFIVYTDTFPTPPEDYPEYIIPGKENNFHGSMQIERFTIDLTKPLGDQLQMKENSTFLPCGCSPVCGCG